MTTDEQKKAAARHNANAVAGAASEAKILLEDASTVFMQCMGSSMMLDVLADMDGAVMKPPANAYGNGLHSYQYHVKNAVTELLKAQQELEVWVNQRVIPTSSFNVPVVTPESSSSVPSCSGEG